MGGTECHVEDCPSERICGHRQWGEEFDPCGKDKPQFYSTSDVALDDGARVAHARLAASPGSLVMPWTLSRGVSGGAVGSHSREHDFVNNGREHSPKAQSRHRAASYLCRATTDLHLPDDFSGPLSLAPSRRRHTFSTKAVYNGEWAGNDRHGRGIQVWPDGTRYDGEWLADCAHGRGCFRFGRGDEYIGEWRQNAANGLGVYRREGIVYMGQFVDDDLLGWGVEKFADGASFAGELTHGQKQGGGVYVFANGSKYIGQWSGNHLDGFGIYEGGDGCRFEGSWRASSMHGCGQYTFPEGGIYRGEYADNHKHGFGTVFSSDGRRCDTYWVKGEADGIGVLDDAEEVESQATPPPPLSDH